MVMVVHSTTPVAPSMSHFSLVVPSPLSASGTRRTSRSHSSSDRDEADSSHHSLLPPHTPRRVTSTPSHSSSLSHPSHLSTWLPLRLRLPSFFSSSTFRPLYRDRLSILDPKVHGLPPFSLPLYLKLLCQVQLPLFVFLLLVLVALIFAAIITFLILQANSLRLSFQFSSPPHPLTPHYPYDPSTLNHTDPAGRALLPDTLHAHLLAQHDLNGEQLPHLEWLAHQADVCVLIVDLCHPKDERYLRYKVQDRYQRGCALYRVVSAQKLQKRREGEDEEEWRPHLSIVQMADRLPFVRSYVHTISTVVEYAETHGYGYYIRLVSELERRGRHPSFGRALAAYEMMHLLPILHPHPPPPPSSSSTLSSHYLFYLDLDAYFNNTFFLHVPLTSYILPSVDLHFQGEDTFCAAVFLTRLSSLSLWFFEHVWSQGLFDYTRRHTWEQKAFTHTLNLLLSGHNSFHYSTHCLTDSCEPLYLQSYIDPPDRLWLQSWGNIAFWPLNRQHSLDQPQVHECVWSHCPQLPGMVVHNGDHSNTVGRWVPNEPQLPKGTCEEEKEGRGRGKSWKGDGRGEGQFRTLDRRIREENATQHRSTNDTIEMDGGGAETEGVVK